MTHDLWVLWRIKFNKDRYNHNIIKYVKSEIEVKIYSIYTGKGNKSLSYSCVDYESCKIKIEFLSERFFLANPD